MNGYFLYLDCSLKFVELGLLLMVSQRVGGKSLPAKAPDIKEFREAEFQREKWNYLK